MGVSNTSHPSNPGPFDSYGCWPNAIPSNMPYGAPDSAQELREIRDELRRIRELMDRDRPSLILTGRVVVDEYERLTR